MVDTTTDTRKVLCTLTETDLLDKLDELRFWSTSTYRHDDPDAGDFAFSHSAMRQQPCAPDCVVLVNDELARVQTNKDGTAIHVSAYGPTRLAALTALVALAEQQADR